MGLRQDVILPRWSIEFEIETERCRCSDEREMPPRVGPSRDVASRLVFFLSFPPRWSLEPGRGYVSGEKEIMGTTLFCSRHINSVAGRGQFSKLLNAPQDLMKRGIVDKIKYCHGGTTSSSPNMLLSIFSPSSKEEYGTLLCSTEKK